MSLIYLLFELSNHFAKLLWLLWPIDLMASHKVIFFKRLMFFERFRAISQFLHSYPDKRQIFLFFPYDHSSLYKTEIFTENIVLSTHYDWVPVWNFTELPFEAFSPCPGAWDCPLNCCYFSTKQAFQTLKPEISKTTDETGRKHETVTRAISGELSHFIIAPFYSNDKKMI